MADDLVPNPDPRIDFPVPDKPVGEYFPLLAPEPADDTFEIGLVLGGTVSAAAYTAGVIDFLIQALDAWTLAKQAGGAPAHKVVIKILSGTSGGALSCAILARILASAFPHCDAATPGAQRKNNPLYDCWVNQVDITDLLQMTDLGGGTVPSLLCADKLDEVGAATAAYVGPALGSNGTPAVRDYVTPHLPVVLTLTNLRGVPYRADFMSDGGRPEYYCNHADHIRFVVDVSGAHPLTAADIGPFEVGIGDSVTGVVQPWSTMIRAARGSAAFPVGLPPQAVTRDPQHYRYRYAVVTGADPQSAPQAAWLRPAWPYMIPIGAEPQTPYSFLTVDGGCFDNEPTEHARQHLAGVLGRNDRFGNRAHRAVVLVDPFADVPDYGLVKDEGLLKTATATLSALKDGARYETADLELFMSEEVFSRFLVNPVRRTKQADGQERTLTGGAAIATNPLGAFGGFLSAAFREHDFLLGRRNCQQFLRTQFVLPDDNNLFDKPRWSDDQRTRYGVDAPGFLPIIPLVPDLETEIPQPDWPKNRFSPSALRPLVKQRLAKLAELEASAITSKLSWPLSWVAGLVVSKIGDYGADQAISAITEALRAADLL